MSAFGELLRAVREQHALSECELSQSLGVTPQTIFEWESGRANSNVPEIVVLRDLFGEEVYTSLVRASHRSR
jgi:predicted transcriptional regulator